MKRLSLATLALWTLSFASQANIPDYPQCQALDGAEVVASAKGLKSQDLIFCEYFFRESESRQRVLYKDTEGDLIVEKTLVRNDRDTHPEVTQKDMRNGEIRQVIKTEEGWQLGFKKSNTQDEMKEVALDESQVDMVDAGFDNLVRENWDALLSGKKLRKKLPSAPLLRSVELRIVRSKKCADDRACFRIQAQNPIIRVILPSIKIEYDLATRRLLRYRGLVNISGPDGKRLSADISYQYFEQPATNPS